MQGALPQRLLHVSFLIGRIIVTRHVKDGEITAAKRSQVSAAGIINMSAAGNQSHTIGFRPKVILFFTSLAGNSGVNHHSGVGIATSAFQFVQCGRSANAAFSRSQSDTHCVGASNADGSFSTQASLVGMNSDGFTLNVNIANSTYNAIPYIAIA